MAIFLLPTNNLQNHENKIPVFDGMNDLTYCVVKDNFRIMELLKRRF